MLADQQVSGKVPDSVFLPEPVDRWLDHLQLTTILSSFAGDAGATQGVHGLALLSTKIGKTTLTADAENPVTLGNDPPDIEVEVQNQGRHRGERRRRQLQLLGWRGAAPG